ncbi:uncharacterized protein FFE2_09849 [Fusarium fujikuroi]|nr:uncharacterized protein FFE2_09849 [Fusarium fujikuroi]SCV54810.1 uncharacterized protein FFB14_13800 [Fusarium fujikuroi]
MRLRTTIAIPFLSNSALGNFDLSLKNIIFSPKLSYVSAALSMIDRKSAESDTTPPGVYWSVFLNLCRT